MHQPINEADQAILKHQIRRQYKQEGAEVMLIVAYELMVSAQLVMEVIVEEYRNEQKG